VSYNTSGFEIAVASRVLVALIAIPVSMVVTAGCEPGSSAISDARTSHTEASYSRWKEIDSPFQDERCFFYKDAGGDSSRGGIVCKLAAEVRLKPRADGSSLETGG